MPLYFFHVCTGSECVEADEGLDYPDDDAARWAAVAGARSLIAADVLEGAIDLSGRIDVADDSGTVLFSVPYSSAVRLT